MKVLFVVIDGQVTGGNMVCLQTLDELLRRGGQAVLVSPADGPFCEMVRARGVPVHLADTRRSFNWGAARRIARLAREHRVDLVHAHAPYAGTVLARLGALLAGVPVLTHAHVRDSLSRRAPVRAYQRALSWATTRMPRSAVIAVSEAVARDFVEQGTSPRALHVVYNGVEAGASTPAGDARAELGIAPAAPVVMHVGRLCESKGQALLIRAARRVVAERPDARFVLVGDDLVEGGAYRARLESVAAELGLGAHVLFTGPRADVARLLASADLLALPSAVEGLPLVVLEAMAAGKPVVATAAGGTAELVRDGETGTLVPYADVPALADALLLHLGDPERSRRMGEAGLRRVRERFSM